MREKFLMGGFGTCPRVLCKRQNVLPIGVAEDLNTSRVKVYCPKCQDVYVPRKGAIDIDGAYFGTSFPLALIQAYPELVQPPGPEKFIPKLYGFRVFGLKGSKYEIDYDATGNKLNEEDVRHILENKRTDAYSQSAMEVD